MGLHFDSYSLWIPEGYPIGPAGGSRCLAGGSEGPGDSITRGSTDDEV